MRKYSTECVESPGAMILAPETPKSPDAGFALHAFVLPIAVVYRKSRFEGVPPFGR
jgi:hypothetical protein